MACPGNIIKEKTFKKIILMTPSRRAFLKGGALALVTAGLGGVPSFIAKAAQSRKLWSPYKRHKIMVCIFQRGAMDGLMAVTPFTDTYLQKDPAFFVHVRS